VILKPPIKKFYPCPNPQTNDTTMWKKSQHRIRTDVDHRYPPPGHPFNRKLEHEVPNHSRCEERVEHLPPVATETPPPPPHFFIAPFPLRFGQPYTCSPVLLSIRSRVLMWVLWSCLRPPLSAPPCFVFSLDSSFGEGRKGRAVRYFLALTAECVAPPPGRPHLLLVPWSLQGYNPPLSSFPP